MAAAPVTIDLLSSSSDDNEGGIEIIASFKNTVDDPIEIVESSSSSLGSVGAIPSLSEPLTDISGKLNDPLPAETSSNSILTPTQESWLPESPQESDLKSQTEHLPPPQESQEPENPSESEVEMQTERILPTQDTRLPEEIIEKCERCPPLTPTSVIGHKRKIIRDGSQELVSRTSQESISAHSQLTISKPEAMLKSLPSDGSSQLPTHQAEVTPKAAAGPRPKANLPSHNAVSSFFCKAKASDVLSQIEGILADKHSSNPTRHPAAPVATVKPAAKDAPAVRVVKVTSAVPEKRPPNANPASSPGVQQIPKDDFMRSQIEKEQREQEKMLEIQRLKQTYKITDTQPVVRPVQQPVQADSFLSSMDPALLAMFAASQASPTKDVPLTQSASDKAAVEEPMIARVYEVFTLDASRNMRQIKPLSLRIAQQNTFGQVKQAYCANRGKNPQGLVLTFNETPLFDSVTVGASGISPRLDEKGCKYVELVIYTREILARVKEEKKKQLESGLEFLDSPVSNVDVSDLMEDTGVAQGSGAATGASGSSMTLSIRFGKGESEILPVTLEMTLQELLSAFQARNSDLDLTKARFKFDGSTLNLSDTIADAELEDEDMLELIL